MESFQQFIETARILLEMPQYIDNDYELNQTELTQPDLYSEKTLSEQFKYIGTIDGRLEQVELYLQEIHSIYCVIGVRSSIEYDKYKRCILSIKLNELHSIDDKVKKLGTKCLAVSLVHCINDSRYSNISTNAYLALSKLGYVIISDEVHYKGAKALWKKLATIGICNVRIFNQSTDDFLIGNNNSVLYNGSNIPDDLIWSNDSSNMEILLVLAND